MSLNYFVGENPFEKAITGGSSQIRFLHAETIGITLLTILGLAVFGLILTIFEFLRWKPGYHELFYPNLECFEYACPCCNSRLMKMISSKTIARLKAPFGWLIILFNISEKESLDRIGIDGMVYLGFLKMAFMLFLLVTVMMASVVPIHVAHASGFNYLILELDKLDAIISNFSISHINNQSGYLWIHVICVYIISCLTLALLVRTQKRIQKLKRYRLCYISQEERIHFRTLLFQGDCRSLLNVKLCLSSGNLAGIESIEYYDSSDAILNQTFEKCGRSLDKLEKLYMSWCFSIDRYDQRGYRRLLWWAPYNESRIKVLHNQMADYEKRIPTSKLMELRPKSWIKYDRDEIDHYSRKLQDTASLFLTEQARLARTEQLHAIFVTFTKPSLAQLAMKDFVTVELSPHPHDIKWGCLQIPLAHRRLRSATVFVAFLAIVHLSIGPFSLIILFANLDNLGMIPIFGSVTRIKSLKWLYFFLKNIAPVLIMRPFNRAIKAALKGELLQVYSAKILYLLFTAAISNCEFRVSKSRIRESLFHKHFIFLIISMKIILPFSSSALKLLSLDSYDLISTLKAIAHVFPLASSFFIRYILLRLIFLPEFLLKPIRPYFRIFKTLFHSTPRGFSEWDKKKRALSISFILPTQLLLFIVVLSYSIISPMILLPGTIYFAISWMVAKSQLLFVQSRHADQDGKYWPIIFNRCFIGLYTQQFVLSCILAAKEAYACSLVTAALVPLTGLAQVYITYQASFIFDALEEITTEKKDLDCKNTNQSMHSIYVNPLRNATVPLIWLPKAISHLVFPVG